MIRAANAKMGGDAHHNRIIAGAVPGGRPTAKGGGTAGALAVRPERDYATSVVMRDRAFSYRVGRRRACNGGALFRQRLKILDCILLDVVGVRITHYARVGRN